MESSANVVDNTGDDLDYKALLRKTFNILNMCKENVLSKMIEEFSPKKNTVLSRVSQANSAKRHKFM